MSRWLVMASVCVPLALVAAEVAESPSLELLEFLGDWETNEGEWLDPLELMLELDKLEADAKTAKVEDGSDGQ